jgi:hypothetical protein
MCHFLTASGHHKQTEHLFFAAVGSGGRALNTMLVRYSLSFAKKLLKQDSNDFHPEPA